MTWVLAELKAADAALSPPVEDPGEAAVALNAQTMPGPLVSVSVAAIHGTLMLSPTGDWLRIEALAGAPHSSGWPTSPTAQDAAIGAAQLALELAASKVTLIDANKWASFSAFLAGLQQAGAISADTLADIQALARPNPTVPVWSPAVTAGDVQTARVQP